MLFHKQQQQQNSFYPQLLHSSALPIDLVIWKKDINQLRKNEDNLKKNLFICHNTNFMTDYCTQAYVLDNSCFIELKIA